MLQPIEGPQTDWDSPLHVLESVLEHEIKVTGLINNLMDLAIKESDHATTNFLQYFVSEQVEEEATVEQIVQKAKLIEKSGGGLFMLDQELGKRPPVAVPGLTGGANA